MICACLCVGQIVYAEDVTVEQNDSESMVVDFSFNSAPVSDEFYSLLKTDLPPSAFRLLHFKYYDWDGDERNGIIIVRREIEFDALDALQDVYEAHILLDDISIFTSDGLSIDFWALLDSMNAEEDTCNKIFSRYGFVYNDNQADGCRDYYYYKELERYPEPFISGPL